MIKSRQNHRNQKERPTCGQTEENAKDRQQRVVGGEHGEHGTQAAQRKAMRVDVNAIALMKVTDEAEQNAANGRAETDDRQEKRAVGRVRRHFRQEQTSLFRVKIRHIVT